MADHERTAGEVLRRHAVKTGWVPALPVPIELIVDQTFGIRIESRMIQEPDGVRILGALFQDDPAIVLNDLHGKLFEAVIGPLEFTLAHELGHWLYDADVGQSALFEASEPVFCYAAGGKGPDATAIREMNANKLAAAVLMPADLVRAADLDDLVSHHREYAQAWGVSGRALEIRLQELGLVGPGQDAGLWG